MRNNVYRFSKIINRRGLEMQSNTVCDWIFYSYFLVYEVVNDTYGTFLCSLLMIISEYHNLNMDRNHGNAIANILLKIIAILLREVTRIKNIEA